MTCPIDLNSCLWCFILVALVEGLSSVFLPGKKTRENARMKSMRVSKQNEWNQRRVWFFCGPLRRRSFSSSDDPSLESRIVRHKGEQMGSSLLFSLSLCTNSRARKTNTHLRKHAIVTLNWHGSIRHSDWTTMSFFLWLFGVICWFVYFCGYLCRLRIYLLV